MKNLSNQDKVLWEQFTKDVRPLRKTNTIHCKPKSSKRTTNCYNNVRFNENYVPEIDLHGLTQDESYNLLVNKLPFYASNNIKKVIVITGKGKEGVGVLKRLVPLWFQSNKELSNIIRRFNETYKNSGSYDVFLK